MWKPKDGNIFNKQYAHVVSSADAFVTGFHYVWFSLPPIFNNVSLLHDVKPEDNEVISIGKEGVNRILVATCTAVTAIPSLTINDTKTLGMNNMKASHVTNLEQSDVITLKFQELMGLPVFNILKYWASVIRDYELGVSRLAEGKYTKDNFSGCLLYWMVAPNGLDIQFIGHYSGIYPKKDPRELFVSDYSSSDKIEADIDFNVDRIRIGKEWMITKAKSLQSIIDKDRKSILNVNGTIC